MTVCTTVTVSAKTFVLARTLAGETAFRIKLKPTVSASDPLTPYVWISSDDPEWITACLRKDADVSEVDTIDQVNGGTLLRVGWDIENNDFLEEILASNGSCLSAVGTNSGWKLTLRYPTRRSLSNCYWNSKDRDVELNVRRVYDSGWMNNHGVESVLTLPQREALNCALKYGYFEIPREVTLQELAEQLGVSDTAASQRLRRGIETLLVEFVEGGAFDGRFS